MNRSELARLLAVCGRAGIQVEYDLNLERACLAMRDGQYVIKLGQMMQGLSEPAQAAVVAHELAHVLRGDLQAMKGQPERNRMAWNIAADVHVNHGLREEDVTEIDGLTYPALRGRVPGLPEHLPGTRPLYERLLGQQKQGQQGQGQTGGQSQGVEGDTGDGAEQNRDGQQGEKGAEGQGRSDDQEQDEQGQAGNGAPEGADGQQSQQGGQEQANQDGQQGGDGFAPNGYAADLDAGDGSVSETEHTKTVMRAREAARQEGVDLPCLPPLGGTMRRLSAEPWKVPARLSTVLQALEACARSARGALVRTRSYSRPGRVEGLRGVIRAPRMRILVALDASGSMHDWAPHAVSAAAALRRTHDVELAVWADTAAMAPRAHLGEWPNVGVGTSPETLVSLVRNFDAVVVITDGQFDARRAQSLEDAAKVVWLITEQGTTEYLPRNARVVEAKR